ncbi:MAG: hypothetical protein JWR69_55 [Pedosphaera sp.]|nr:hypothetical protein [Pedosphaera sp.]
MIDAVIVSARTEERPFLHAFTKNDIVGSCPTMANLNYDPFPDNKPDDIVRRELIGRELLLHATLKGKDVVNVRPGTALHHEGHAFMIKEAEIDFMDNTSKVEGSAFLTDCEPRQTLMKLREMFAASNRP